MSGGSSAGMAQCWIQSTLSVYIRPPTWNLLPRTHYFLAVPSGNFPPGSFPCFPLFSPPLSPYYHHIRITIYIWVVPNPISMLIAPIGYTAVNFLVSPPSRPETNVIEDAAEFVYLYIYNICRYLSQHRVVVNK